VSLPKKWWLEIKTESRRKKIFEPEFDSKKNTTIYHSIKRIIYKNSFVGGENGFVGVIETCVRHGGLECRIV
jgi:hypothetical protein